MQRDRLAGTVSIVLGLGMATNALLGPLALHIIRFRESQHMETQLAGGELTSLFLAAPIALGWSLAWRALAPRPLAALDTGLRHVIGGLLVVTNAFFALAWIASIAAVLVGPPPADYVEHPTAFWLIRLMDLGFVIPVGLVIGVGLLRRAGWATHGAYAFVGMQMLLMCAVAGMAVRMWARGDPDVTVVMLVVSAAGALAFVASYAVLLHNAARTARVPRVEPAG